MTPPEQSIISLEDATFGYRRRAVVSVESLALSRACCTGMYGPNGSGKTTLVRGLCGLLKPLSGQVRTSHPIRIGYIAQHRAADTTWPMSGFDACAMHVSSRRRCGWVGSDRARVMRSMELLQVAHLARAEFGALSGGQQQRIRLAGALADEPSLLVLDEPTDGLDRDSRAQLLKALTDAKGRDVSIAIISHEVSDLLEVADQFVTLDTPEHAGEPSKTRPMSRQAFTAACAPVVA